MFGKGASPLKAKVPESGYIHKLDTEIEALRERLHRLVSSNPSQLRTLAVYELSTRLDNLITRLQTIKQEHSNHMATFQDCERSESVK